MSLLLGSRAVRGPQVPGPSGPARGAVRRSLVWAVVSLPVTWLAVPGPTAAVAGLVGAGILITLLLTGGHPVAGAGSVVAVIGAGTTAQLLDAPVSWGLLVAGAVLLVAAAGLTRGSLAVPLRPAVVLGLAACTTAIVVRALPMLWGRSASGLMTVGGIDVRIGEFTRPLLVVGLALFLAAPSVFRPYDRGVRIPVAAGLAVLAVAGLAVSADLGPAALVGVAAWAVIARAHGGRASVLGPLMVAVPLAVAAWQVLPGYARARFSDTWFGATRPEGQAGVARALLSDSALFGPGWDGVHGTAALPAASTDYVLLSLIVGVGSAVAVAVVALVMTALVWAARQLESRTDVPALVGTGAIVLLGGQVTLATLGAVGLLPLTGLPFPLLSSTGSSVLPAALLLGAVVGSTAGRGQPRLARPSTSGRLLSVALRGCALSLVAGLVLATVLGAGSARVGDARLALFLPRGALLTADGHVIAPPAEGVTDRRYPDGDLYLSVGWTSPQAVYGLERTQQEQLTCGADRGWWTELTAAVLAAPCRPVDVVTTLRHDLMLTAQGALADEPAATVVVADAADGSVLVDLSSGVGRVTDPDGSGRAAGGVDGDQGAPSRILSSAPGSIFKLITAGAALESGVEASPENPERYRTPEGTYVSNQWDGACPGDRIEDMIAFSCNTTAADLAEQVGADRLDQVARELFGFEASTVGGLSVVPSTTGLSGDAGADALARTAFGQGGARAGVLAMTQAVVQLLTGGEPRGLTYVAGTVDDDGAVRPAAAAEDGPSRGVPAAVAERVLAGMRGAVERGTAQELGRRFPAAELAAKTSSAEAVRDGVAVTDSWITVVVDERYVIAVAVWGSAADPDPSHRGAALQLALPLIDAVLSER